MKKALLKFKPLPWLCTGVCVATFVFLCASLMIVFQSVGRHEDIEIAFTVFSALLALHMGLVLCSIFKWNSTVFLFEDAIVQMQWGRKVMISYAEINNVRMFRGLHPSPPIVAVYSDNHRISFDMLKCGLFLQHCTNQKVIDKVKTLQYQ